MGASRATALRCPTVITGATNARVDMKALELLGAAIDAAHFGVKFEHPFLDTQNGHAFKVAEALGIWDQALTMTRDCLQGGQGVYAWGVGCGECEGCLRRAEGHEKIVAMLKEELAHGQAKN